MQDIVISFTLKDALMALLLIVSIAAITTLIVLLIKFIKAAGQLNDTITKTNKILDDVSVISENAKNGTEEAKVLIAKFAATASGVADIIDTNKGSIAAISNLANAGASLASLSKKKPVKKKLKK